MSDQHQAGGSGAGSTARCGEPAHGSGDRACRNFVAHGATHCRAHGGTPHDLRAELEAARAEIERLQTNFDAQVAATEGCYQEIYDAKRDLAQARARISELVKLTYQQHEVVKAVRSCVESYSAGNGIWPQFDELTRQLVALDAATATKAADA